MTTESDFSQLSTIVTDEYVRKYLFDDEVLEPNQVLDILLRSIESFKQNGYGLWLIHDTPSQIITGMVGLWEFFDEPRPQLLYALLPDYLGKGIAAEASREIIRYSFDTLGFNYLCSSCDTPNTSSHKVAERLGMVKTKEETINGKPITFYRIENKSGLDINLI
jgi:ribosomal-protein-alanine N-acetyltransferase